MEARFAEVGGQSLLFCPSRRAIFGLNETASDIWRSIEDGRTVEEIERAMTRSGVDPAATHVGGTLVEWERMGLIRRRLDPADTVPCVRQTVEIAGVRARISYPPAHAHPSAATLRHLEAPAEAADTRLELVGREDWIDVYRDGGWLARCRPDGIAPALRTHLLAAVLELGDHELALHAASLIRDDRTLLICGGPGAGKTTLSLGLSEAGFGFAGDDVALLDAAGRSTGVPLAPVVKRGGWRMLARRRRAPADTPVFRRADGVRVRYPLSDRVKTASARTIGWIVLLDRVAKGQARLEPVSPVDALRDLLRGASAREQELTASAFDALVRAVDRARIGRLTFSGLEDAAAILDGWCR